MRWKVKCGDKFEAEVVGDQDKYAFKVIGIAVVAVATLVGVLVIYGAVKDDFSAYEKTLDTIVKLTKL